MAMTPGRPHDATIHPRTKPEANEYAVRNRGTGDWFRHDGKNIEQAAPPPVRLPAKNAGEYAAKNKGEPDQWFQHNHNNPPDPKPAARQPTAESKQVAGKVAGKEEPWYKHEDNADYHSERKDRLPNHGPSKNLKEKFTKPNTNDWYKHSGHPEPKTEKTPSKVKQSPKAKQQQAAPFATEVDRKNPQVATVHSRTNNPEADTYLERNRGGSAASWFGHEATADQSLPSPRSKGGDKEISGRLGKESENWYDYDANKNKEPAAVAPKGSKASQAMVEKSRGSEMENILSGNSTEFENVDGRVKPEAQEIAQKNRQGLMDKFLQQNPDYNSPRPEPRIKPEASDVAEKNKGVMGECMEGYPDPPTEKSSLRVRPEAQENANRNKGTMGNVIGGAPPSERQVNGRTPRTDAEVYADRNQGTLKGMMDNYGNMSLNTPPAQRLQSDAARANAERNKGSMGHVLGFSSLG